MNCNTMVKQQLQLSCDWLTVTVYATSLNEFLEWFDQFLPHTTDVWLPGKPLRMYDHALKLNGQNYISLEYSFAKKEIGNSGIFVEADEDTIEQRVESGVNRGILLNISGDGLRYLGNDIVMKIASRLSDKWQTHYTRFDIACDFYDPDNVIIPLILDAVRNTLEEQEHCPRIITRSRDMKIFINKDRFKKSTSVSATIGTRGGKYARIYDKCLEQRQQKYNTEVFDEIPDYWYRIELEVRPSSRAEGPDELVYNLLNGMTLQDAFVHSLNKFFRVDNFKAQYATYWRSDTNSEWQEFLETISKSQILYSWVYLRFVGKSSSVYKNFSHYSRMLFTALSILPKDYVLKLYEQWASDMQRSSSRSEHYRQQIFEFKGSDYNMVNLFDHGAFVHDFKYNPYSMSSVDELPF